jgi:hypothetical protein
MTKRCPACSETKPAAEFGRNRSLKDGLSFYCLACNRERNNAWYREHRRAMGKDVRDCSWIPDGFRWCPSCEQPVAHGDYVRNRATASGFGSRCKACDSITNSESYFFRKYKLTKRQLADMREAQDDRCAICGETSPQHLDHDHSTGMTRQFLCQRCNQGLGLMRDDPAVLRAAADYVEMHRRRRERPQPLRSRRPQVTARPAARGDGIRVWRVRHRDLVSGRSVAALAQWLRDA